MESRRNRLLIRHGWSKKQFSRLPLDEQDYWLSWEYHEEQEAEQRAVALEERISSMYDDADSERVANASGKKVNADALMGHALLELLRLIGKASHSNL